MKLKNIFLIMNATILLLLALYFISTEQYFLKKKYIPLQLQNIELMLSNLKYSIEVGNENRSIQNRISDVPMKTTLIQAVYIIENNKVFLSSSQEKIGLSLQDVKQGISSQYILERQLIPKTIPKQGAEDATLSTRQKKESSQTKNPAASNKQPSLKRWQLVFVLNSQEILSINNKNFYQGLYISMSFIISYIFLNLILLSFLNSLLYNSIKSIQSIFNGKGLAVQSISGIFVENKIMLNLFHRIHNKYNQKQNMFAEKTLYNKSLLENLDYILLEVDKKGHVISMNNSAIKKLALKKIENKQLAKEPTLLLESLVSQEGLLKIKQAFSSAKQSHPCSTQVESFLISHTGKKIFCLLYLTCIKKTFTDSENSSLVRQKEFYRIVAVDISQRREMEERLNRAKLSAEAANATSSLFYSTINHEMRTPLNAVINLSRVMLEEKNTLSKEQFEELNIIHDSGHRLLGLLNNVLEISRVYTSSEKSNITEVSFPILIKSLEMTLHNITKNKAISVEIKQDSSLQQMALADERLILQTFSYLLINTCRKQEKGLIVFSLTIKGSSLKAELRLLHAMKATHASAIVDAHNLALIRDNIERLHGSCHIEENEWPALLIDIPLQLHPSKILENTYSFKQNKINKQPPTTMQTNATQTDTISCLLSSAPSLGKASMNSMLTKKTKTNAHTKTPYPLRRILIIDDEAIGRKTIEKTLQDHLSIHLELSANGETALDIFREKNENIDLVLMDISLPDISGLKLFQLFKDINDKIPIIAFTAHGEKEFIGNIFQHGFFDYLQKPYTKEVLLEKIDLAYRQKNEIQETKIDLGVPL